MTGAMFIARCFEQEGVTKVFGQCGHTNYALIDACHKLGIEYVSFRHEQQAAHAADAYYRVSHKLAVVNVHLSPGLTNALTGVATAAADFTPMLVIAGNTPSDHHAREPHQGSASMPTPRKATSFGRSANASGELMPPRYLPDVMPRALNLAQTGKPGAVLLDVPMDVFSGQVDAPPITVSRRAEPRPADRGRQQRCASRAIARAARRPVIIAGNGVTLAEASAELRELAERIGAPVATTLMAKGIFPEDHRLALGMIGIWGIARGERNGATAPT